MVTHPQPARVATERYGYTPFHWYMLARDCEPIAYDGSKMTFTTHGAEMTGKPMPDGPASTTRTETPAAS